MTTAFVFDERYLWHNPGSAAHFVPAGGYVEPMGHVESPQSKGRFHSLVEASGLARELVSLAPYAVEETDLLRYHSLEYVERVRHLSEADGGEAGIDTRIGRGSFEIALLAVGGACRAIDAVLDAEVDNAYALVRPPGHHALPDQGVGMCVFANVALAVKRAQEVRGLGRIAIVDWDVHHGNGTQTAFYEEADVLTISLHQDGWLPPGSGRLDERGAEAGVGGNLNIPLPAGSGWGAYSLAMETVVVPALRAFGPELIVVASGLDAAAFDPLAHMVLHSEAYRAMTGLLLEAAADLCDGRLAMCHEGGYDPAYVPFCGLAIVEALSGVRTDCSDPFLAMLDRPEVQGLQPHQQAAVERAARLVG